ncbi:MAG: glycosyltransferase family 4 protein [Lentisphaerae bacterium]|nr:glycosyltransferase family 4 protein [Lentisphaerota bacterium]
MVGLRAIGQWEACQRAASASSANTHLDLFSGVEKAVEEISTRLVSRGHEVTVFCRRRYNITRADSFRGIRLRSLPAIYTKHLEAISHTFLASVSAARGYDIVHFHATGPSLLSFLPRLFGTHVVATVHGLDWQRQKWGGFATGILRAGAWAAGRFPHRTVVVSKSLQRYYRETYNCEAVYIPNGVTPGKEVNVDHIERFGVAGDDFVLFLGRLVPEKGCHLLIEAFRDVQTQKKLLIVGGGSYTDNYVTELKRIADGDERIVFTGSLYGRDKAELYSNASFLVMPSSLEGMPIVILEAMSHGCPVLCSDIPPHMEIIAGSGEQEFPAGSAATRYGFPFRADSMEALKSEMERALASPAKTKDIGAKARDYVIQPFSWDHIVDRTEELYRELIPASPSGA